MPSILCLTFAAAFVGCSFTPQYKVYHVYDEFDDFTAYDMDGNYLAGNERHEAVQLNISERRSGGGDARYALHVVYESPVRLDIQSNQSLVLLVDGQRMGFSLTDSTESAHTADSGCYGGYGYAYRFELGAYHSPAYAPPHASLVFRCKRGYAHRPYYPYGYGHRYGGRYSAGYSYPVRRCGYFYYTPYNLYLREPYGKHSRPLISPHLGRFHKYPYGYGFDPYPNRYGRHPDYGVYAADLNTVKIREEKVYPVTLDDLRKIASASEVKVRVVGRYRIQRYFKGANLEIFQRFVQEASLRAAGN